MSKLSEQEKAELKAMAASAQLREEFRLLEEGARAASTRMSLDHYISFLATMSRLCPTPPPPKPFVPYSNVRL